MSGKKKVSSVSACTPGKKIAKGGGVTTGGNPGLRNQTVKPWQKKKRRERLQGMYAKTVFSEKGKGAWKKALPVIRKTNG